MQQTMERYKSGFKTFFFTIIITTLFTGCNEITKNDIYFVLDVFGLLHAREPMIDISIEKKQAGEPFSFNEYCYGKFDKIFIVYPYYNVKEKEFNDIVMSNTLRIKCDNNTSFDSFSTLLFISNDTVKAYSIIGVEKAIITPPQIPEKMCLFPIEQKFILDKNRYVHLYNE